MNQIAMDSDDNAADQMDDNLLEPLSEVSFLEREESFTTSTSKAMHSVSSTVKDGDVTLPDARARMLHLQRVQRGGGSSGSETAKSSSSKKRNSKSHSADKDNNKEETVSLSLDSLIRRGVMNDVKKAVNFQNNFKFGKPDDDISLRVNPTANLFYDHSNTPSDSESAESYESSGDGDGADESEFGVTSNGSITNGNNADDHGQAKRKRGRPRLTEEEKSERAAQKQALRMQNQSILNSSAMTSQVDDFMAMGHSIFHSNEPQKKRGRPAKNTYPHFLNSTMKSEYTDTDHDPTRLNDSVNDIANATEFPVKKKRGRKPKSYYLELAAQNNEAGVISSPQNGTDLNNVSYPPAETGPLSFQHAFVKWQ